MKTILKLKFNPIFIYIIFLNINKSNAIDVNTTSGLVRGMSVNVLNKSVNQFLNIPYAEPPLGELRFAKTKPLQRPRDAIIDGTKPGYSCIQNVQDQLVVNPVSEDHLVISEDCLVLNIWSPNDTSTLKPVMFWIYGGGLATGSIFISLYNGSVLATNDVVVVSVNYRLGALGFLISDTDESAPGNAGLYDQQMALKWVRENIHLFGGDKNQITIFGESAGSISVSAHLLSPLTKGLFRRAIMESGSVMMERLLSEVLGMPKHVAINNAKLFAKSVNCPINQQMVQCLRRVDAEKFIPFIPLTFPTWKTEYLPFNNAEEAFITNNFNKDLDIIAGFNRNEGSILGTTLEVILVDLVKILKKFIDQKIFPLSVLNIHNLNELNNTITKGNSSRQKGSTNPIFDFIGYIFLKCPTYLFTRRYAQHSSKNDNIFVYHLTHTSYPYPLLGVYHTADISLVFGTALLDSSVSQQDKDFTRQVMDYWTDFAKYGKPKNWHKFMSDNLGFIRDFETKILNPNYSDIYDRHTFETFCEKIWSKVP